MNKLVIVLVTTVLAGCASLDSVHITTEQRAARNLCEVMRSYRPYYPDECGEHSGVPLTSRAR